MTNPAFEVQKFGQSLWLDYIHREELNSGELQRRIAEEGLLGVTSNPSIFQKAIGESDIYDAAMSQMRDLDIEAIYEKLVIADIQTAADLFRPIYDQTHARDGYVSLEVSPRLASNTEATIAEAQRLFAAVDRPNLMIKIPGTPAGIPAIEAAIAAGININVTLLFAVSNYEQVAEAYIKGLERRVAAGEAIDKVASVASFFLSRIDTAVDRVLTNNLRIAQVHADTARMSANRVLLGQAAVASAKLAYQIFKRHFETSRFRALQQKGAQVQRLLWASTSTKDAAYEDTRYVDALIGADTVNTLPPQTLAAFINHGTAAATLEKEIGDDMPPDEVMQKLAGCGIDMEAITRRLQVDGVDAFADSFETLLEQIQAKLTVIKSGVMDRQRLALGIYAQAVNKAITDIEKRFINGRIWNKDGSVWKTYNPTIQAIEKRLGWLDVLDTIDIGRLKTLQAEIQESDIEYIVLLGMGGSSLAPDVLFRTFRQQAGFPALLVLDSTDPARIQAVEAALDVAKTLFVVSSKSGSTVETLSFYRHFWQQTGRKGEQFIAITDPDTPLAQLAQEQQFRHCFLNPADIGGRYSALSYFGMVPAALMGLDLDKLSDNARLMIEASHENIPGLYHPGVSLGALIGALCKEGRDKVTIYASQSLVAFGDWAEQLLAESLGKEHKGVVPVVSDKIGSPAEYVTDRLFIYLRVDDDPHVETMDAPVRALREAGHPRATLRVPDKYAIAGEFFRWEFATAIAGYIMELNPFDEPNVSEAKEATQTKLTFYEEHGHLPRTAPIISGEHMQLFIDDTTVTPLRELCRAHGYDPHSRKEVLAAQFAGTHAGDYFAFLCYFTPDEQTSALMDEIQRRLRKVTKRAVTVGYGPRYLHSTGQLHKGGANNGIFFQITFKGTPDIAIPGANYSFGTLFAAQAAGDLEALQKHNRRVVRLHIDDNLANGLHKILDAIQFVEDRRF